MNALLVSSKGAALSHPLHAGEIEVSVSAPVETRASEDQIKKKTEPDAQAASRGAWEGSQGVRVKPLVTLTPSCTRRVCEQVWACLWESAAASEGTAQSSFVLHPSADF